MSELHEHVVIPKKALPPGLIKFGWTCLLTGGVLIALSYVLDLQRALINNLIGFALLTGIAVGAVFYIALEYIAGAVWSTPFRRVTEFLAATLPFVILFSIPLLLNMHEIYHWTHADVVAKDPVLQSKAPYLNIQFFLIRFAVMMALWLLFYFVFKKHSLAQDLNKEQHHTKTNIKFAGAFIPVFAITLSVFAIDWLMSLEPHWFSTIFAVYFFIGSIVCALGIITYLVVYLSTRGYFFTGITEDHYYTFGALLFGFLSFWAYIAFSQFMLIWYANLPEENFWFIARWKNGWEYVSMALALFHFWLPYFLLVSRPSKMNIGNLKRVSIMLVLAHILDLYWMVMPTFYPAPVFSFYEIAFPLFVIGLAVVVFASQAKKYNLVPVGDPKLQRGMDFHL